MTFLKSVLVGATTGIVLRAIVVVFVISGPFDTFSAGYFLLHAPLTTFAHICGGYVAGRLAGGQERVVAFAAALFVPVFGSLILALFPSIAQEIFKYGQSVSYLTYFTSGVIEAGFGFLLGGQIAKSVREFRSVRVLGSVALTRSARVTLLTGGFIASAYGMVLTGSALAVFIYRYIVTGVGISDPIAAAIIRLTLLVLAGSAGGTLYAFGRRMRYAPKYSQASMPDVLILRSFVDDNIVLNKKSVSTLTRLFPLDLLLAPYTEVPFFDLVTQVMSGLGNVVILGSPEEDLPATRGGARIYFPAVGLDWKNYVEHCLRDARVIVLVPGKTAGLKWEMEQVSHAGHLRKTIVLCPPAEMPTDKRERLLTFSRIVGEEDAIRSSILANENAGGVLVGVLLASSKSPLIQARSSAYEDVREALLEASRRLASAQH